MVSRSLTKVSRVAVPALLFLLLLTPVSFAAVQSAPQAASRKAKTQEIRCTATRDPHKKNDWACTAQCPAGTHVVTGGGYLAKDQPAGPFSAGPSGNGWYCDFGEIDGCHTRTCGFACFAVCAGKG